MHRRTQPGESAFGRLRTYARSHNRRLHDITTDLTDGTLDMSHDDPANE